MTGETGAQRFFGKYRGLVAGIDDPLALGRVLVEIPVLAEGVLNWAMPCAPYVGPGVGAIAVPPVRAEVWVEFEGGDPNSPIWTGCCWGMDRPPVVVMPG